MCLGIPGRVEEVHAGAGGVPMGTVSFDGIQKEVCMACVPDVAAGEYVVVHVGFAIGRIEESEARQVFDLLGRLGELEGLGRPAPPPGEAPPPMAPGRARRAAPA